MIKQEPHPKGLYVLFFTEMWERFSYYGMRGLLILYLTKAVIEGGLGFNDKSAGLIYGIYTGLVYLTPVIGGWIADRFIGQRKAILIGGLLMALGQFLLASQLNLFVFYLGLAGLIIGNGFFKPNISTLVGRLYKQGDSRRDSAFTIFYMGINLGAFLAPLICGYFAEDLFSKKIIQPDGTIKIVEYAFQYGFLAAGIGMVLGQLIFNLLAPKYLGDIGCQPAHKLEGNTIENKPLSKAEKDRVTVILVLACFMVFFWAGFEQAGSSMSLYTDRYINRVVGGWEIPTSWFQSVNPLFIVLLAPIFTFLWTRLGNRGKEPSVTVKMGLGMVLLGLGFLLMVGAVIQRGGDNAPDIYKASLLWLLGAYLIHTMGELCLSPVGLSMVTKLAPVKLASLLMGVWFLSSFVANFLSGFLVQFFEQFGAQTIFGLIALFVIVLGFILIFLNPYLKKLMHGIN
jgi:proton-dependent oligopeptide transporter, POT family